MRPVIPDIRCRSEVEALRTTGVRTFLPSQFCVRMPKPDINDVSQSEQDLIRGTDQNGPQPPFAAVQLENTRGMEFNTLEQNQ